MKLSWKQFSQNISSKKNLMEAEKAIYVRVFLGFEFQVVHSNLNMYNFELRKFK